LKNPGATDLTVYGINAPTASSILATKYADCATVPAQVLKVKVLPINHVAGSTVTVTGSTLTTETL
jgi:hypothetical protein